MMPMQPSSIVNIPPTVRLVYFITTSVTIVPMAAHAPETILRSVVVLVSNPNPDIIDGPAIKLVMNCFNRLRAYQMLLIHH